MRRVELDGGIHALPTERFARRGRVRLPRAKRARDDRHVDVGLPRKEVGWRTGELRDDRTHVEPIE